MIIEATIKSLAIETQLSSDYLINIFSELGIKKTIFDSISQKEKNIILKHLNNNKKIISNTLTLNRITSSTLNVISPDGKNKLVEVIVRKKHIYTQHSQKMSETLKIDTNLISKENNLSLKDIKNKKYINNIKNISINHSDSLSLINNKKNKKNTQFINKSSEIITDKARNKSEEEKMQKIAEKENRRKSGKKRFKITEEVRIIDKKKPHYWNIECEFKKEDTIERPITISNNIRKTEDEYDGKIKENRRIRTNIGKISKQKKNNKLFISKNEYEESRILLRKNKNKKRINLFTQRFNKPIKIVSKNIIINETITVAELANKMAVKGSSVIKELIKMGIMVTINQTIDEKTARTIVEKMGHKVIIRRENSLEESILFDRNNSNNDNIKESRDPIVTIMGHVDHGKTSLLDYIRSAKVAINESGGITQHIGAYQVKTKNGMITFLDTPGHAAFQTIRSRGAKVTDIIVLVVAADDGIMPQTIESITHAKIANVPIIVAINKIDKPDIKIDQIKNDLTKHGIIPEEWGGDNQFINISAKLGTGINKLLNAILLQAEILELKTKRNGMASGIVIESFLDKGRGPVATAIIKEGVLKKGNSILCGMEYGSVRTMQNALGKDIYLAGPSIPVKIFGLSGLPVAGDIIMAVKNDKKAKEVAVYRQRKYREIKMSKKQYKLENMFSNINADNKSELNIILKSDTQGSSEAIINALKNLSNTEIKINIISAGVGSITETDVTQAIASHSILLGFNVRADTSARRIIDAEHIYLRYYSVIYDLINEVKNSITGMLSPKFKKEIIGTAEVRNTFRSPKFGTIAGCMVIEGIIKKNNNARILRNNIIIYEGELESLRRFKDDVNIVRKGMECGIGVKNYNDINFGDIIEVFENIEVIRTLSK